MPAESGQTRRYRQNLQDEIDSVALYTALSHSESDPARKDIFRQLAQAENEHADFWRKKLLAEGANDFPSQPALKARLLILAARRFGTKFVLPTVTANEYADRNKYFNQPDASELSAEEYGHASVLGAVARPGDLPSGRDIASSEPWHRGGSGNELRAAVLGVNDGLVSNFCLVMGVAGAGVSSSIVLLTGLAGLVGGALSMALGEWLSVTNARELAKAQIGKESMELEQTPEAEKKELSLIYQAKGIERKQAWQIASKVMENHDMALETLAREELGIDPAELGGNPWSAAGVSLLLFSLGAACPLLPFFFWDGATAIAVSILFGLLGLGATGMVTALFNGRGFIFSAVRQILFGGAAAAITFGVGRLFGISVA